jgi:hypothetical protein
MKDTRNPLPQAANKLIDEATMSLSDVEQFAIQILNGGMTDVEIYRRIGLILAKTHDVMTSLRQAQNVGRNNRKDE